MISGSRPKKEWRRCEDEYCYCWLWSSGKSGTCRSQKRDDLCVLIDDPALGKNNEHDCFIDAVIVAVATPMGEDGKCVTENVEDVFTKYGPQMKYLVKSTIDPLWLKNNCPADTTFAPEFLRGTTGNDPTQEFLDSTYAIYGGGSARWWHELFAPCLDKLKDVRFVSLEQAAFGKYVINTFLATKVTFMNEMYRLYNQLGFQDFDGMIESVCLDKRIGFSHTQVPSPDGKFGYGGHCFPKDVSALLNLCDDIELRLLHSVQSTNEVYRNAN